MTAPSPLERFLEQDHRPGTNLKGDAPRATWRFLLPDPAPTTITFVGRPPKGELRDLRREIDVRVVDEGEAVAAGGVVVVRRGDPARYLVAGSGTVLWERRFAKGPSSMPAATAYRLTPAHGELRTATPLADAVAWRDHLRANQDAVSFGLGSISRVRRSLGSAATLGAGGGDPGSRGWKRPLLRTAARIALGGSTAIERWARRHTPIVDRTLHVAGGGIGDGSLPTYLAELAGSAPGRWWLSAPGDYRTQKLLVHLAMPDAGSVIVKIGRDADTSGRVQHATAMLRHLAGLSLAHGIVPRVAFSGSRGPHEIVGEHAVIGRPFESVSDGTHTCPHARRVVTALVELGAASHAMPATDALDAVASQFLAALPRETESGRRLRSDADALRSPSGVRDLPCVLMHGDPGTWNLLVDETGIGLLDWENGELAGVPGWDVLLFMHAYALHHDQLAGRPDRWSVVDRHFVERSPLSPLIEWGLREVAAVAGVAPSTMTHLVASVLAYQSLKELPRLMVGERGVWLHALDRWHRGAKGSWLSESLQHA